jgi:hypothetical protein
MVRAHYNNVVRQCYKRAMAVLHDNVERLLWQWCMAMCAHIATLTRYGVHDNSLQQSHNKFHLFIY